MAERLGPSGTAMVGSRWFVKTNPETTATVVDVDGVIIIYDTATSESRVRRLTWHNGITPWSDVWVRTPSPPPLRDRQPYYLSDAERDAVVRYLELDLKPEAGSVDLHALLSAKLRLSEDADD